MRKTILIFGMLIVLMSLLVSALPPAKICCPQSSDCVFCGRCYESGQTVDVDGNLDMDVCKNGKWGDCSSDSHCLTGYKCDGSGDCVPGCSNEGGACSTTDDCCNPGSTDGKNYCSSSHCCPVGKYWNGASCEDGAEECYNSPCPYTASGNFNAWIGYSACVSSSSKKACCYDSDGRLGYSSGYWYETITTYN